MDRSQTTKEQWSWTLCPGSKNRGLWNLGFTISNFKRERERKRQMRKKFSLRTEFGFQTIGWLLYFFIIATTPEAIPLSLEELTYKIHHFRVWASRCRNKNISVYLKDSLKVQSKNPNLEASFPSFLPITPLVTVI